MYSLVSIACSVATTAGIWGQQPDKLAEVTVKWLHLSGFIDISPEVCSYQHEVGYYPSKKRSERGIYLCFSAANGADMEHWNIGFRLYL